MGLFLFRGIGIINVPAKGLQGFSDDSWGLQVAVKVKVIGDQLAVFVS